MAAPPTRTVVASLPAAPPPCGNFIFLPRFCMALSGGLRQGAAACVQKQAPMKLCRITAAATFQMSQNAAFMMVHERHLSFMPRQYKARAQECL